MCIHVRRKTDFFPLLLFVLTDLRELVQEQDGNCLTSTHREVFRHSSQDAISKTRVVSLYILEIIGVTPQVAAQTALF